MPHRFHQTVNKRACLCALSLLFIGKLAVAGDIVVKVEGVQAEGAVSLALVFADQALWPQALLREIHSRESSIRLRNLPAGRYAIQLYQDTNGNGQLDLSPRGVPLEPVGFSANPVLVNGKPTPLQCMVEHGAGDTEVVVRLQSPRAKP